MKTYLIAIDKEGHNRLGSNYTHISNLKTERGWKNEARRMQKACNDIVEVYALSSYPQNMCEMGREPFTFYVRMVGTRVL